MKVLIVSATLFESRFLGADFKLYNSPAQTHTNFPIPVLITGPGILSTTFSLTETLKHYQPDIIINMGIAGAINQQLKTGTHCVVTSDSYLDSGIYRNNAFKHLSECDFSTEKNRFIKAGADITLLMPEYIAVTGQTVSLYYDMPLCRRPEPYRQNNADLETMEGAAVFFIARQLGIPACSIRTISNVVGEAHTNEDFEKAAALNCAAVETLVMRLDAS